MKDKFIRKYMRIAKEIGDYENPCYSRKIGSVIVNPKTNNIIGLGYNGPPKNVPHCDSEWHLKNIVWPNISLKEKEDLCKKVKISERELKYYRFNFENIQQLVDKRTRSYYECTSEFLSNRYTECKKCPRRLLNIPSGERLELCSCEHAERNAIYNAQTSTQDCYIFCHCCLPCMDCSKAIINSGIKKIFCLSSTEDYSPQSRPMLEVTNIEIIEHDEEWYDLKGV